MNVLKKIESELKKYYVDKSISNVNAKRVGWKNEMAQEIRFEQLFRSFKLVDGDSIIDLGCGLGDLYQYLIKFNQEINLSYFGVDLLEEMIFEAKKRHINASFEQIDTISSIKNSDYIVASGIFNLKHNAFEDEWLEYIHETISIMYNKSNKGVSFNCLTLFCDKEFIREELYYCDPIKLFEFCMKNISNNVSIYHDYKQFDFTISITK